MCLAKGVKTVLVPAAAVPSCPRECDIYLDDLSEKSRSFGTGEHLSLERPMRDGSFCRRPFCLERKGALFLMLRVRI